MKKWALAVLMAICLVLPAQPGIARAAEQGWIYDPAAETLTSGTTVLNNVTADGDELSIGDSSGAEIVHLDLTKPVADKNNNGYSITQIDFPGFRGSKSLQSVNLPNSIRKISSFSFSECPALTTINLPESTMELEGHTFEQCPNLKTVSLPRGLKSLGNSEFQDCSSLVTLEIPDSVTSIGPAAFWGCSNLQTIDLPKGLKSIKPNLFRYCISLESALLPSQLIAIEEGGFFGCSSLADMDLPATIQLIGENAFHGCANLTSVTIPEGVSTIERWTFSDCSALKSVKLPSTVASIDYGAFSGCTSLDSIALPDSIKTIGDWSFNQCESLQAIEIPNSVTSIGEFAFHQCKSLQTANFPDNIKKVSKGVFMHCNKLQSIEIPHGVTEIGQSAFSGCWAFKSLSIPDTVKHIGDGAFWSCSNMRRISILAPTPPARPGNNTFNDTPFLGAIIVPAKSLDAYKTAKEWGGSLRPNILKAGFVLTVDGHPSSKLHLSGDSITIEAPSKDACHPFDHWDLTGVQVENADESPLTFAMPENDAVATPVYVERHAWSEPEWTWSENGRSCEAAFACANDTSHAETVEAEVTSAVKTPATCTENGVTAYTATAEHEGETFTATTERADVPATGHTFENGTCTECGAKDPNHKPDEKPVVPEGGTGDSSRPGAPNDPDSKPSDNQIENPGNGQVGQGGNGRPENQDNQSVSSGDETLVQTGDASLAFAAASCLGGLIAATGISMRKRTN